jgi:hypothetical protein
LKLPVNFKFRANLRRLLPRGSTPVLIYGRQTHLPGADATAQATFLAPKL